MRQYNQNIDKLLDLGKELIGKVDYKELGLNSDDGHNLLKMVTDDKFHFSNINSNHPYAPIHAIYALGHLKIEEYFNEISQLSEKYEDDKYILNAIRAYGIELNLLEEELVEEVKKEEEKEEEIVSIVVEEETVEEVKEDKEKEEEIASVVVEEEIVEEVKEEKEKEEIASVVVEEETVEEVKEEEVIVLKSDEIIKEAIDEMQQDKSKPRQPKGRPPVKEPVKEIKVGRNDPCPCGSGKKYKKCCINL